METPVVLARAHVACVVLAGEYMRFRDPLATRNDVPLVGPVVYKC